MYEHTTLLSDNGVAVLYVPLNGRFQSIRRQSKIALSSTARISSRTPHGDAAVWSSHQSASSVALSLSVAVIKFTLRASGRRGLATVANSQSVAQLAGGTGRGGGGGQTYDAYVQTAAPSAQGYGPRVTNAGHSDLGTTLVLLHKLRSCATADCKCEEGASKT